MAGWRRGEADIAPIRESASLRGQRAAARKSSDVDRRGEHVQLHVSMLRGYADSVDERQSVLSSGSCQACVVRMAEITRRTQSGGEAR